MFIKPAESLKVGKQKIDIEFKRNTGKRKKTILSLKIKIWSR